MKILIAPNAFKGTLEADEAAASISASLEEILPAIQTDLCPIADGGDGTCYLLSRALGLPRKTLMALDPIGRPVKGFYSLDGQRAFMDVSTVSGIRYLSRHHLDPWTCSSYGTGQLIQAAREKGAQEIVLGLGGSASIDLGLGILRALGYLFLDQQGREISVFSPGYMAKIAHIQNPIQKNNLSFILLCDVNHLFFGPEGAIPVFGPQKGLKEIDASQYEETARSMTEMLYRKSGKTFTDQPGFGAAGGIGLGLSAFFPVEIKMGANWFFEQVGLESRIKSADLVITGEGRYDAQSVGGKGSFELLQLARKYQKKIVLITSGNAGTAHGFDWIWELPPLDLQEKAAETLARTNLRSVVKKGFQSFLEAKK